MDERSTGMSNEVLSGLLEKLPSSEDKEQLLEALSVITDNVSKKIISKAASPNSPVSISEFPDVNETTMVRHLHLLEQIGLLKEVWEDNKRKFAITDLGKKVSIVLEGTK